MSNQLSELLYAWQAGKNQAQWVLGTVYRTEGSAYRKAGALMLINSHGQQFGLLSGGCLEADIIRNARKVMFTGQCQTLVYDATDEDDLSYQLGIGCGGKVYIMLQPITEENDLGLGDMLNAMTARENGIYHQKIGETEAFFQTGNPRSLRRSVMEDGWLLTPISPEPHLLIIGGGMDARPVASMAKEMGWQVTVADPRAANARSEFFPRADKILREQGVELTSYIQNHKVDAAVLMSHSVNLDADALTACQHTGLKYIALLGPKHRYFQVLERAKLAEADLTCPVSGPAGLKIGGQLPESIALSILAECHGVLHQEIKVPQLQLVAE